MSKKIEVRWILVYNDCIYMQKMHEHGQNTDIRNVCIIFYRKSE